VFYGQAVFPFNEGFMTRLRGFAHAGGQGDVIDRARKGQGRRFFGFPPAFVGAAFDEGEFFGGQGARFEDAYEGGDRG
jgi:hypothetical protein